MSFITYWRRVWKVGIAIRKCFATALFLTLSVLTSNETFGQCSPLVPHFDIDLTGQSDSNWISPSVTRNDNCCGTSAPDRCVSFTITLDPSAVGIIFNIYSGAAPGGSLFYQIDCGPPQSVGSPICLAGPGPYSLTFCKPGANVNQYSITSIKGASITPTTLNADCFSSNNGSINLNVSGGVPPYSFQWSDGSTAQNRTNLAAGTYVVTISDTIACATAVVTDTIIVKQGVIGISTTQTNLQCYGVNAGSINLTTSGGASPFTYSWSGGINTQNRTNLAAGTYDVTITDINLCSATASVAITQPALLSISANVVSNVSCFGGNNGAINLNASGGTSPYRYYWSVGITTQNRTHLTAGSYNVTITDSNSCSATTSAVITQPVAPLSTSVASTNNVSCFGGNNGSISMNVSGGTSAYTFNWTGGLSTQNATNLTAGIYIVTVTDANLCTATDTAAILQPAAALDAAIASTNNVSCFGGNNGAINLNVSGGTSPYTYNWTGGTTTQNRTNLIAGIYDVTVTDSNLCSATLAATIAQPPAPLSATPNVGSNISCFGGNNGAINLNVSGGTLPYTYNWTGGSATQNRTNLTAGNYNVTVTDSNLCSATAAAVISQPAALNANVASTNNVSCFGGNNGAINLVVNGGTTSYTYNWTGGSTTQDRTNLTAGNYDVTVTDANLCSVSATATITQPPAPLSATIASSNNVTCFAGNNGTINLNVSGGTSPYAYNWTGGTTTQNRTNLIAGNYDVTVTDANLCSATAVAAIAQPPAPLSPTIVSSNNVSCFAGNNGAINLNVSGGASPYTYNWTGGFTTQNRTNLIAGNYDVTVTDVNLCSVSAAATIAQPAAPLSASANVASNVNCFGGNNGAINLIANGGTSPYTYSWTGGGTTQNRTNLTAGIYDVTVTDANLCSSTAVATITQPPAPLSAAIASSNNVSCFAGNNGAINLNVSGGTSPYTYNWTDGSASQNKTNLTAGNYVVTVTDANLCSSTAAATITQPPAPLSVATIASTNNISCFGGNNGAINLNASGGTSPYTYSWTGGTTTQNRINLSAGNYDVTVTDANLCSSTAAATITQPPAPLNATIASSNNVSCFAGNNGAINLNVSGGTSPYTYNWTGGGAMQNRANLTAGIYDVTVTDANLCSSTAAATITQPPAPLSATIASTNNVSCFAGNNGAINLNVSGGTSPYTYNWSGGIITQNRTNLTAGNYNVTVTDANLCSSTVAATITQPPAPLSASPNVASNVNCFGGNNGAINLNVSGGTSPYTYSWTGGTTTQNRTNLSAGNYDVTVTDANLCSSTVAATITQPPAPLSAMIASTNNVSCFAGSNGAINLNVSGGTSPYSYRWNDQATTQNRVNLSEGSYYVTITDANSCTTNSSASISQPSAPLNSVAAVHAVSCYGGNNGSITLTVTGGTSPYAYSWNGGITTSNRTGLTSGKYTVTVTDSLLCVSTLSAIVNQPLAELLGVPKPTNVLCFGLQDGGVSLTVSGGVGPYAFKWDDGVTSQNRTNLVAGTYQVHVIDSNSCFTEVITVIAEPTALSLSATPIPVSCFGGNNGIVNTTVGGGVPPYSYRWDYGFTTQNRSNLTSGTYNVTLSDANTCSTTASATVTQPAFPLTDSVASSKVSCFGGNNGALSLHVTGGTSPYSYNWGGGVNTQNRTNLAAGTYSVTFSDSNGCTASSPASVSQPSLPLSISSAINNVSCFGGANGTINLTASGGTSQYFYNWNDGPATQNRANLSQGTYMATITDANSCSATIPATINQPPAPLNVSANISNVNCYGGGNGAINLSVSGGTSPYSYNWAGGITLQNRNDLLAGVYRVTVTDSNGCTLSDSASIAQPLAALSASGSVASINCFGGNNGAINLSVSGGTAPYQYNWGGGVTTQNRNNLSSGNYNVTITDNKGCSITLSSFVPQPSNALSTSSAITNASCYGSTDGIINLSVTGGTPVYTYNWGGGIITQNRNNLSSGTYGVTITDANGCTFSSSPVVGQPASALQATTVVSKVSCFGGTNGSIVLTATGGTSPYNYNWGGGINTQNRNDLSMGTYSVTITDKNGCVSTTFANITQPASALGVTASTSAVSCNGGNNGNISLTVSGGTSPYSYNWGGGVITANRNDLAAGIYHVTITDKNSCSAFDAITIMQPSSPLGAYATSSAVRCFNGNDGSIQLNTNGGTPPYNYDWNDGASAQNRNNLAAGTYQATVTDSNGCAVHLSAVIGSPDSIVISATTTEPGCYSGTNGTIHITVSGGTPAYQFAWSNGAVFQDITNIGSGAYSITVLDAHGCISGLNQIIVAQPQALNAEATVTHGSCGGTRNGKLSSSASGGTPPYQFNWNNNATGQDLNNLSPGSYLLTVTDAHGCIQTANAAVNQFPDLAADGYTNPLPCAEAKGEIYLYPTSGTPPYSYLWNDGATSQDLTDVHPGRYSVTVEDSNGCNFDTAFVIENLNSFSVDASNGGTITLGQTFKLSVTGTGSAQTVYNWNPDYGLSCTECQATIAQPGETTLYTVIGTDTNGCTAKDTVTIYVIDNHNIFIPNAFSPNGDGNNDYFQIFGNLEGIHSINAMVFDRWGEKVFESEETDFKWDGTYKGVLQNPSVYVYVIQITFLDNSNTLRKGSVTLIR